MRIRSLRIRIYNSYVMWRARHHWRNLGIALIWKLPHRLVYWCALRLMMQGVDGNRVFERSCGEALKYYDDHFMGDRYRLIAHRRGDF